MQKPTVRREFLRVSACAAVGSIAGCIGGNTSTSTESETDTTLGRGAGTSPTDPFPGYERTAVTVESPAGERLGTVTAAVADTASTRYVGLSQTESLPADWGMLFVYGDPGERTFVMRGMAFGIDIVFADAEKRIRRIHHATEPGPDETGSEQRYPGFGQYVLEVNRGWTSERDVTDGDRLVFDLPG